MSCIYVETKTNKYPIYFKNGFSDLKAAVEETGLSGRKLCLIADSNTGKLYAEKVKKEMEGSFEEIYVYMFEAGEKNKNLSTISDMYSFFIENRVDRKTVVACLGGGVCGDMAGFAAATYL